MASSFPPDNNDNNNQAAEQSRSNNNNNNNNSNTTTVVANATNNDNTTATNGNTNNNNNINEDAVEPRRQVQVVQHQAANNPNNTTSLLPLDWTQMGEQQQQEALPVRYPGDVAEILPDETEICIVGTAGQKITVMGANFSDTVNNEHLTQLILRSHLIRKMEGLEKFHNLELLELYDNQIDELTCLNNNNSGSDGSDGSTPTTGNTTKLRVLDMSYNVIRDMLPVKFCPNLQELYLANNKLKTIAGLSNLKQLKKLDLGANRIRVMDATELDGLTNLEELWLGKNKIEKIDGLSKLVKLRRLDVQSNRLSTIEHLDTIAPNLEELYLAHNGITNDGAEHGLSNLSFPNLSVLDLSRNRLTTTTMFSHLTSLDELWLSGNKIAEFANISCLSAIDNLDTIYLEYNPIAEDPLYRKRIKELLPSLSQIDATMIASVASVTGIPSSTTTTTTTAATTQDVQQLQEMAVQRAKEETEQASAGGGGAKK